jgi:hypothetical protein
MRDHLKMLPAAVWLAACLPALAVTNALPHLYPSGLLVVSNLGNDLYLTLDPKFQHSLDPNPVTLENMESPVITPVAANGGNKNSGVVSISAGYIDLVNHLAHAKAIDRVQPGYFAQYALNLARESGSNSRAQPPDIIDDRYWKADVMNEQSSYFNQMVGMTLALNLAHHYLGHFNQYASQMLAGKLVPINNFIPPASWDSGVRAASLNCLNCALAMDGARALFDAIDKMPKRPDWTAFIVPPATDLKKLNKELVKYENDFFHGQLK